MKPGISIFLVFVLLSIFHFSCTKTSPEQGDQPLLNGEVTKQNDCLDQMNTFNNQQADSNQSCIVYVYNAATNQLNITHKNAGFNCCPGDIRCQVTLSNDTIIIEEFEEYPMCNCNCLFDLEIEINGVLPNTYFLKFIEPYAGDQEKLEFQIELDQHPSAEYCVERNLYPWGI